MAGEASGSFLPLEGLGSGNGKATTYGMSGETNKFAALTSSGSVYEHWSGALTSPMQKLTASISMGGTFRADMLAPSASAAGHFGMQAHLTSPMQTLALTLTLPIVIRADLIAPMAISAGHVLVGSGWSAALVAPMARLAGSAGMGGRAALVAPMQLVAGHFSAEERFHASLIAPLPRVAGTISVFSYPWSAALVAPMAVAGPYGSARLTAPMQTVAGSFAIPALFEAWVLNVRNGGMTRWLNYPFVQFTRAGNDTFAVGADGNLYLLGGDLDNAAPIQWRFDTGLDDLDSPGVKHIPYLYIDGIIDGEIQIVLFDDRGREFAYEYDTQGRGAVHMPHRRKLGNGIRTRNVGFRLLSTTGAYVEIDSLAPEATVTQRNI